MIAQHGEHTVATSIVVASELRFGAMKRGSVRLSHQLEAVLGALDILPLEPPSDTRYAALRVALEGAGTPMGPNNMLIAAHALALDLAVVTGNISEFSRVRTLTAVNWMERHD